MEPLSDALKDHGDQQVPAGALDLAVNVLGPTPAWLLEELRGVDLVGYPDPAPATAALAARHGTAPGRGAWCSPAPPRRSRWSRTRCGPGWPPASTRRSPRPEAALRASRGAGPPGAPRSGRRLRRWTPRRCPRKPTWWCSAVPTTRPDASTPSRRSPPSPVPGGSSSWTRPSRSSCPTRCGLHASGDPGAAVRAQPHQALGTGRAARRLPARSVGRWSPGSATHVSRGPSARSRSGRSTLLAPAEDQRRRRSAAVVPPTATRCSVRWRPLPLTVWASPANFLLLRSARPDLRARLLEHGVAVRRGETFPGLDPHHVRVAVHPDPAARAALVSALVSTLGEVLASEEHADLRSPARSRPLPHRPARATPHPGARWRPVRQVTARPAAAGRLRPRCSTSRRDRSRTAATPTGRPGSPNTGATGRTAGPPSRPTTFAAALETADAAGARRLPGHLARRSHGRRRGLGVRGRRHRMAASRSTPRSTGCCRRGGRHRCRWSAVSNEVGSGVVPGTRSGVLFRDALGRLNRQVADLTDDVRLVVAGRVQRLDGERA